MNEKIYNSMPSIRTIFNWWSPDIDTDKLSEFTHGKCHARLPDRCFNCGYFAGFGPDGDYPKF